MEFTKNQTSAINVEGGSILVSAAAGSGKTAVLTERMLRLLTASPPIPADRLLVVTYTVAAAEEMRRRIGEKLAKKLMENPADSLLQSQQLLLSNARISTIHSLCAGLVKDNFQTLGISSQMKIADETELTILQNETISALLEQCYAAGDTDFLSLVEFTCVKDDSRLIEILLQLYKFIRTFPFPLSFLERLRKMYHGSLTINDNPWSNVLCAHARAAVEQAILILKKCCDEMEQADFSLYEKYAPAFVREIFQLEEAEEYLKRGDLLSAGKVINPNCYEKPRCANAPKGTDEYLKKRMKNRRDDVHEIIKKLVAQGICDTEEEFAEDMELLRPQIETLFDLVRNLYISIQEKKQEAERMDYADLEHYAVSLLLEEEPKQGSKELKRSAVALALQAGIEEIMIDECQDINEVQNLIFRLLSHDEHNIFMVGDVKQSIYRFRQACPALFVEKKKLYPIYDSEAHTIDKEAVIVLEENFRSRKEVCAAVNYIFEQLMSEEVGDIEYSEGERLIPGAEYPTPDDADTELHILIPPKEKEKGDEAEDTPLSDDTGAENGAAQTENEAVQEETNLESEARYVAELIRSRVEGGMKVSENGVLRSCRYRDFAIILRNKKDAGSVYTRVLTSCGIPCFSDTGEGYFESYEVTVMINLLRVIDNPLLDLPLVSLLLSPVFGFTPDSMAAIRLVEKKIPFYQALKKAAEGDNKEAASFLLVLDKFRERAAMLPVATLLQEIYDTTDFALLAHAQIGGEQKNANLLLLLQYAQSYDSFGFGGLSGFVRYLDRVQENKQDLSSANIASASGDTVKIMSVHASKGLEFPVCILGNCGRGINKKELNTPYQMNGDLGFCMKVTDSSASKSYNPMPFEAIRIKREQEGVSEELRVLYVALTRAKEKLILITTLPQGIKKLASISDICAAGGASVYERLHAASFSDWLLMSLLPHPDMENVRKEAGCEEISIRQADFPLKGVIAPLPKPLPQKPEERVFISSSDSSVVERLKLQLEQSYEFTPLTTTPAKLTVTQIAKQKQKTSIQLNVRPSFLHEEQGGESEFSPAERGTLLHSFMQFADFNNARINLKSEIDRLTERGLFTKREAEALELDKLNGFLKSRLCQRICTNSVYRELKFNFFIEASEVDAALEESFAKEKIFVQGIADCVIREKDGLILLDYKTDRGASPYTLKKRYYDQLRLYKGAIEEMLELPVKECLIYALDLSEEIKVI